MPPRIDGRGHVTVLYSRTFSPLWWSEEAWFIVQRSGGALVRLQELPRSGFHAGQHPRLYRAGAHGRQPAGACWSTRSRTSASAPVSPRRSPNWAEPEEVRAVLKGEDRGSASSIRIDAVLTYAPEGDAARSVVRAGDRDPGQARPARRVDRPAALRRGGAAVRRGVHPGVHRRRAGGSRDPTLCAAHTLPKVSWWRRLLAALRPGSRSAG